MIKKMAFAIVSFYHKVLRTDIVMDLGESLNPAIDIGQIEGGFMQGYGLFVMEQLIHSPNGALLTKGKRHFFFTEFYRFHGGSVCVVCLFFLKIDLCLTIAMQ